MTKRLSKSLLQSCDYLATIGTFIAALDLIVKYNSEHVHYCHSGDKVHVGTGPQRTCECCNNEGGDKT